MIVKRNAVVAGLRSCAHCGASALFPNARFCGHCGANMSDLAGEQAASSGHAQAKYSRRKNPSFAATLSLLWMGLGQIYVGEVARGIALSVLNLVLTVIFASIRISVWARSKWGVGLFLFGMIVWIMSAVDAYETAKHKNYQSALGAK